jgi:large subunit ribosomal protein L23
MDPYKVIIEPLSTEKSVRLMEAQNELIFIVNPKSNKKQIKKAIEEMFNVKIERVNTVNDMKGRKKAYVKFHKDYPAIDVGTRLGLI